MWDSEYGFEDEFSELTRVGKKKQFRMSGLNIRRIKILNKTKMTQEQEFQEVIKKNLPQQVGEVLKGRLEQADKDASEVKRLNVLLNKCADDKANLEERIEKYQQFDTRNSLLEAAEKQLETERNKFELEKLSYQLAAEKDKTEFTKSVALGLVRNTEYRKTIFDSENPGGLPIIDGQGQYHYPISTSKLHTSEEKQE